MRSNDPAVFEHLIQAVRRQIACIFADALLRPLFLQEKNKGKPGWSFLQEGGEGRGQRAVAAVEQVVDGAGDRSGSL